MPVFHGHRHRVAIPPFALILWVVCFRLLRALQQEQARLDLEAANFRHALRGWLADAQGSAGSAGSGVRDMRSGDQSAS